MQSTPSHSIGSSSDREVGERDIKYSPERRCHGSYVASGPPALCSPPVVEGGQAVEVSVDYPRRANVTRHARS